MRSNKNKLMAGEMPLRVEPLRASHITMLATLGEVRRISWLQNMLFRGWIAQAEKGLPKWIKAKQPFCLVAVERNKPVAFVVIKACNRNRTCWSVSLPELLTEPNENSYVNISRQLIKSAIQKESTRAQSWLIRCDLNDIDQIALSRELGFQALKSFSCWQGSKEAGNIQCKNIGLQRELEWQQISKLNADKLWRLEQSSESSQLRFILDRKLVETTDSNLKECGILVAHRDTQRSAIAALINRCWSEDHARLELLRDIAWDKRLEDSLPYILNQLNNSTKDITLETSTEDKTLNDLIIRFGWNIKCEKILFGRTLWRKHEKRMVVPATNSLETILGKLNPNTPPLPTPSLGPR